jgi:hypothetical protein
MPRKRSGGAATAKKAVQPLTVDKVSLGANLNSDGTPNNQLYNAVNRGATLIVLDTGDKEIVLHTTEKGSEPTSIPPDLRQFMYNLIMAATSGNTLSGDGAVRWLAKENVQALDYWGKLMDGAYTLSMATRGRSGAKKYEIPVQQLIGTVQAKMPWVLHSINEYPPDREVAEQESGAVTIEVEWML